MAELRTLYLDEVTEKEEALWLSEMDAAARERAEKTAHPLRRRQRITGDHLAREAVAGLTGRSPAEVELLRLPSGKPYAEGGFFSVSHCGQLVVCASGKHPVGVDAERLRPYDVRIPSRYFSPAEQAVLNASPEMEKHRCFWRIWTGKEALVKLTGAGLAGLKAADTCAPPQGVQLSWQELEEYIVALAEQTE